MHLISTWLLCNVLLLDSTPYPFSFSLQTSLQKPLQQPPFSVPTAKPTNTTRFLVCNLIPDESLSPEKNMLPGQAAQFAEPLRTAGKTSCTQQGGCGWAPNIRKASDWMYGINDSRVRLQTKKNTQSRLYTHLPSALPRVGLVSSCQLMSQANNLFLACVQRLSSPLSLFLR